MKKYFIFLIVATVFLLIGCSNSNLEGNAVNKAPLETASVKEIEIDAFQFGFSPDTVTVKKGEKVKLIINNLDIDHGIRIPDLNLKGDNSIEFVADKVGEFNWYCNNMCGPGHSSMKGLLKVEE